MKHYLKITPLVGRIPSWVRLTQICLLGPSITKFIKKGHVCPFSKMEGKPTKSQASCDETEVLG
jgi:hypothetical protein